jgi:hypothetical protein
LLLFPAAGDGALEPGAVTVIVAPPAAGGAWTVTAAALLVIVLVLVIVIVLAAPQISLAGFLGAARETPESNATAVAEVSFMLGVRRR